MPKTLVVVESPAKAKTIKKYLGQGYEVLASKGHVKDLPKRMGIDVEKGFQESYEVIEAKAKVLSELKTEAKKADVLLLATDPDREGEAIAWHIAEELTRPELEVKRVEFNEITKKGVEHGIENPRELDKALYDAQRARRVLDRIVGYDVSALVWQKLAFGLSAGRVQSVALRLIVEREREIEAFIPEEYWNVSVGLRGTAPQTVLARLVKAEGKKIEVKNGADAAELHKDLSSASYRVGAITQREQKRNAPAPYTTSKLQQDATSYLRFTTKRTMSIAQKLYEGVDLKKDGGLVGLITYMRTDSVRVSADAVAEAREYIKARYGEKNLPAKPNVYKSRKDAQEAHEAIRPTSLELSPDKVKKHLTDEQYKLYKLIWDRFIASQMEKAVYDQTAVDIEATPGRKDKRYAQLTLRANGKVLKFGGWLDQYGKGFGDEDGEGPKELAGEEEQRDGEAAKAEAATSRVVEDEEGLLPELKEGEVLTVYEPPGVLTEQKFTQPPARFNEGSLVRELEKRGIGRPSTYAEIISKVQARDYVEKLPGGQMKATELGKIIVDGLIGTHLDFMEPSFTAKMEEELDEVEHGKLERTALLGRFYRRFREVLETAKKEKRWSPEPEPTDLKCDECGSTLNKRWSKNGWFLGCSAYPKCKFTKDLGKDGQTPAEVRVTDIKCDKCEKPMVIKTGRYGEFLSCSGYPQCKNTKPVPLGVPCPKCGGDIVEIRSKKRGSRSFYGCGNYPQCDFKVWQKPVKEPCPQCEHPFLVVGGGAKNPKLVCPKGKECGYSRPLDEQDALLIAGGLPPAGANGTNGASEDGETAPDAPEAEKRRQRHEQALPVPFGDRISMNPVSYVAERAARSVTIVGAGLAGSEAALTLANAGVDVELFEQKPAERTPAQVSDKLCELVCSNSFRGAALSNAVGLLKEEMRRAGSFVMAVADRTRVPAGGALAVDRERFAAEMTALLEAHPRIRIRSERVDRVPDARPLVIATGPLTGDRLAEDIARRVGAEALAYYDAIAPIVSAESIDWSKVFFASRWEKGESAEDKSAYVNCPLDEAQYKEFVRAVREARKVAPKAFEEPRYFEGCLPIEVMAERGEQTLSFGPMKPVGLTDPKTGRWPHAVVQLRKEDEAGTAYNLVGFQTRMAWPDQERIFRTIPGLENAEFYRFGAVHRNTFLNAPKLLEPSCELRGEPGLYFAGQITGTEGYVESAAGGLIVALLLIDRLSGREPLFPPRTTALGGLLTHLSRNPDDYQPSNITFSHLPPWEGARLQKRAKYEAISARALRDLDGWLADRHARANGSAATGAQNSA